ncbi:uncharacterized protein LOC116024181 [Ipomoea triloba]|uniref:uncharacterized protein LOC116024181 n=1 Tax=Ipomoea triloba TaxID=35885 RepID=UPI00125CD549|nr:uncharacterized protein LOC116024181 [Ipomoea triloba]
MNIVVWNCQGAGGRGVHRVLKQIIQSHRPGILGLVEPKVSGSQANVICLKLGFSDWIRVEAFGVSGGIWVLWNDHSQVSVIFTHPQFVLLQVQAAGQTPWFCAVVYGSPTHHLRRRLWSELCSVKRGISGPLLVAGDFNSIIDQSETSNYGAYSVQHSVDFVDWIQTEGLLDLGFTGPKFTWTKGVTTG